MPISRKREEAEAQGITPEMVKEMGIRGKLSKATTWEKAMKEHAKRKAANTTSTEIALAPAPENPSPATPQGAIVPHDHRILRHTTE